MECKTEWKELRENPSPALFSKVLSLLLVKKVLVTIYKEMCGRRSDQLKIRPWDIVPPGQQKMLVIKSLFSHQILYFYYYKWKQMCTCAKRSLAMNVG